jgi:predicted dehydrogenase
VTRALVIGYGSIGKRHARVLRELGCEVSVVSRHAAELGCYPTIRDALSAAAPDYVVVANETSAHLAAVESLRVEGFTGKLLIEKPLGEGPPPPVDQFAQVGVAYNLRFHPLLSALRDRLADDRLCAFEVYCGQHLPDWRPGDNYRTGYSADPSRGGGVLRDLSHELDYLLWIAGPWRRLASLGGRLGDLGIRSDDCWGLLLELERCPVATVQINYLDHPGVRRIRVNGARRTYSVEFDAGRIVVDGAAQEFEVGRDDTYRAQHEAMLSGEADRLCTFTEGENVMALIGAVEEARDGGRWVSA